MAAVTNTNNLTGLARAMVNHGWLSEGDAEGLWRRASQSGESFVTELVRGGRYKAGQVAEFAAVSFGFPYLDLNAMDAESLPQGLLDPKLVEKRRVLALYQRGNKLFVATSDPTQLQALDEVKFQTGQAVEPVVVEDDKLSRLIEKAGQTAESTLAVLNTEDLNLDFADEESAAAQQENGGIDIDDAPVVRYLQKIMLDAINMGASDIHLEPYEKYYRIRYRRDGVLSEVAQPPMAIKDKVASRIKVLSRLDISEKRVPQDGRMKLVLSKNRAIDFRVSTLPTLYGEKIVMRILDPTSAQLGIEALGYEPWQKEILLNAVQRPYGMVLVTGPTGSGKTVSLYTCLNILNKPDVNISTAEDPAEIQLPGINQVNVNDKAGLTFSAALKSFLRQDPDVIMVGEIRDLETADIAIKAAQTGHMVMSTLHTNDAPGTLTRLLNMGVAPFNVASSVVLITAQRLARRLCACKQPVDIPQEALLAAGFTKKLLDGTWKPYKPVGCDLCGGTGYKGRVGIYQVMPITDAMTRIILKGGNESDIADQARSEGVLDLRQAGLLKVKAGLTSLEEVEAVTNL
ncbi:MAG: type IV-A pilus assembly ATPase PilB [Thiobacillus sp.]|uniref:type IV-A pilus assembly ATPase PilB n=1 Tax=Thiobacillus sp. TaxID=924 RepID=UPI002894CB6E|nr:type IV-A pilus assembly ATPase PilB [Thiobacillus sp.]MDT3705633.1 type IV-A pilus assembly ATPase PilB [Thiobacillus sp.]